MNLTLSSTFTDKNGFIHRCVDICHRLLVYDVPRHYVHDSELEECVVPHRNIFLSERQGHIRLGFVSIRTGRVHYVIRHRNEAQLYQIISGKELRQLVAQTFVRGSGLRGRVRLRMVPLARWVEPEHQLRHRRSADWWMGQFLDRHCPPIGSSVGQLCWRMRLFIGRTEIPE